MGLDTYFYVLHMLISKFSLQHEFRIYASQQLHNNALVPP